jgi:ABC-2 type transport system permease protein
LSWTRLAAICRKEILQLRRDPRSLGLAFLLPVILLALFGFAITWDIRNIETAVLDRDRSPESREMLAALWASGYFVPVADLAEESEVVPLLDRMGAQLVVVIPPGFARDVGAGQGATLQAVVDGSDANTATIILAYARAVVRQFAQVRTPSAPGTPPPVPLAVETRVWFNEELESRNMIVPGLVAVIMMIIAAQLTSLTLAREWERGTMEQLAATPVSRVEVVIGKLLPYLAIGLVDVLVISVLGVALFGVPFRGSPLLLVVLSFLFLVGALGLGMFISAAARSQLLATQLAMLTTFLPAFLLSGFMFPIAIMPIALRGLTFLVPARYFLVVTRGIFLKGVGLDVLRVEAGLMLVFAVAGLGLAILAFRKELA